MREIFQAFNAKSSEEENERISHGFVIFRAYFFFWRTVILADGNLFQNFWLPFLLFFLKPVDKERFRQVMQTKFFRRLCATFLHQTRKKNSGLHVKQSLQFAQMSNNNLTYDTWNLSGHGYLKAINFLAKSSNHLFFIHHCRDFIHSTNICVKCTRLDNLRQ